MFRQYLQEGDVKGHWGRTEMGMEMMNSGEEANLPLVSGLINTSALHPNESKLASLLSLPARTPPHPTPPARPP